MGYIRHEAVIAVFHNFQAEDATAKLAALKNDMPEEFRHYLVGPITGINCYATFFLAPDGSKEGWPPSDAMDDWRQKFIEVAKSVHLGPDLVHLQLGGDDRETAIHHTTDGKVLCLQTEFTPDEE